MTVTDLDDDSRDKGACLRWLSLQVVGGRGGLPVCDMQAIAAAAADGRDWRAVRDERAAKRVEQRRLRSFDRAYRCGNVTR
jgi:hypothetical protein